MFNIPSKQLRDAFNKYRIPNQYKASEYTKLLKWRLDLNKVDDNKVMVMDATMAKKYKDHFVMWVSTQDKRNPYGKYDDIRSNTVLGFTFGGTVIDYTGYKDKLAFYRNVGTFNKLQTLSDLAIVIDVIHVNEIRINLMNLREQRKQVKSQLEQVHNTKIVKALNKERYTEALNERILNNNTPIEQVVTETIEFLNKKLTFGMLNKDNIETNKYDHLPILGINPKWGDRLTFSSITDAMSKVLEMYERYLSAVREYKVNLQEAKKDNDEKSINYIQRRYERASAEYKVRIHTAKSEINNYKWAI